MHNVQEGRARVASHGGPAGDGALGRRREDGGEQRDNLWLAGEEDRRGTAEGGVRQRQGHVGHESGGGLVGRRRRGWLAIGSGGRRRQSLDEGGQPARGHDGLTTRRRLAGDRHDGGGVRLELRRTLQGLARGRLGRLGLGVELNGGGWLEERQGVLDQRGAQQLRQQLAVVQAKAEQEEHLGTQAQGQRVRWRRAALQDGKEREEGGADCRLVQRRAAHWRLGEVRQGEGGLRLQGWLPARRRLHERQQRRDGAVLAQGESAGRMRGERAEAGAGAREDRGAILSQIRLAPSGDGLRRGLRRGFRGRRLAGVDDDGRSRLRSPRRGRRDQRQKRRRGRECGRCSSRIAKACQHL